MAEQAEALMIRAAFTLVSTDAGVLSRWDTVRLLEIGTDLNSYSGRTLGIAGVPVRPRDLPSKSQDIYVDIWFVLFLVSEETTIDSSLIVTNEFNELRKLLTSNLPLLDGSGNHVSDDYVDFAFRGADLTKPGIRRIFFVARYSSKIDPTTGLQIS